MSPIDLAVVERSWSELSPRRDELVDHLTNLLTIECAGQAAARAAWLAGAVDRLVALLPAPSALGRQARRLVATWPCAGSPPTFPVDGRAWMTAAARVDPTWTGETARAWRQAWLLLSEELAESSLSPFAYVGPRSEDT